MNDRDAYDQDEEYEARDIDTNPTERGKWISVVVALLGLWMLAQAVWLEPAGANFWSDVAVGIGLIALGGYNYYRRANEEVGSVAVGSLVALLGLWLIVAPFLLGSGTAGGGGGIETDAEFWNDIIVGLGALILGAYSAYEARETEERVARPARG